MSSLSEWMARHPIVPYIRESDYAIRLPWSYPERRLLDYLLIYIQEGECLFTVDGTDHFFASGEWCLIQPGSRNALKGLTSTITPFAHLDLFYNPIREQSFPTRAGQIDLSAYSELMQPRLNDMTGIHLPVRLVPRNPLAFRDRFLETIGCWMQRSPLQQLKAQSLATDLILTMLEDHTDEESVSRTNPESLNGIPSFLSLRLSEPLSVAEMARRANLSPSRFTAVFRKRFGTSPHQYLLELRIRHARELLETTPLKLEEIAEYCGFSDIHHFSKAFKKRTGVSPGSCRPSQGVRR
ncbi:AraC family transcriptional regulator [Paenibacillus sp. CC-CFT747]|nr:AraC family transcriptional regulator [Paenibacillus sp. CC-CFT747]